MIDPPSEPDPPGRRQQAGAVLPRVLVGLALVAVVLIALASALYLNRRAVAREMLVGWLERRGIEAEVAVERIGLGGFVGRIRLGEPADPDLAIERAEIDYAIGWPWSATGLGVTPRRVRLLRPVVGANWRDGKFSMGQLDPLVQEFLRGPARPATRGLVVVVEGGQLRLDTPYGPLQVVGDARLEDGRLMRLAARMPAAQVNGGDLRARGLGGTLDLATTGDRVAIRMEAAAERFAYAAATGEDARLTVAGDMPYPDLEAQRADGPLTLTADVTAAKLAAAPGGARTVQIHAAFQGEAAGGMAAWQVTGEGDVDVAAGAVDALGSTAQGLQAVLTGARLGLERDGKGLGWSLKSASTIAARQFDFGELSLQRVRAALDLDGGAGTAPDGAIRMQAEGSLQAAAGTWPLLGAPAADDTPDLVQVKRALRAFSIRAPGVRLAAGREGTSVVLTEAARLSPANGGRLLFAPVARPLYQAEPGQPGGGALRLLATRGRGLPEASFAVPDWHLTATGFEARLDGRAALDFEPAQGIRLETRGVLALAGERLSYVARDCLRLTVERVELDENDVTGVSGALCPDGRPLLTAMNGAWKVQGDFRGVSADAPSVAVRLTDFQGRMRANGSPRGLAFDASVAGGRAADGMNPARFNPLAASGSLALQAGRWSGTFDLAAGARRIGRMTLAHDGSTAAGGVRIEVPDLVFAEGGLQPSDLSALAGTYVQSPATGSIRFDGWIDWMGEAGSSGGRLVIPRLDFTSPAGAVKGLKGAIEFTSLTPLATAPDQTLSVDRLVAATEVTGLNVVFALDAGSLRVAGGELSAAGGRVLATPFAIPLDLTRPFSGTIVLESLQLGKVVADAGIGDKFSLDAVVSGRLPFVWTPGQGVRIVGGALAAVRPGRLALRREVLAQVQTSSVEQVPSGVVEDLAYQAMENLAFDALSVEVNSLDEGRVGLVFRVKGRHDPPQRQDLRVGLAELLSRRFLRRKLPLPSDTRIDLTLDTTLNLNQLIADLLAVNRARQGNGSGPAATRP